MDYISLQEAAKKWGISEGVYKSSVRKNVYLVLLLLF